MSDSRKEERGQLKEALRRYMFLSQSISDQMERLQELRMESIGSPEMSDMPKTKTMAGDKIGNKIVKIEMIEEDISEMQREFCELGRVMSRIESKMKRAVEKKVINLRYEDGHDWNEIARRIYAEKGVSINRYNEDSCRRYVQTIHGDALDSILSICGANPELRFW